MSECLQQQENNILGCDIKWAKNVSPLHRSPYKTIASVIRGFKIGVIKFIRKIQQHISKP